VRTITGHPHRPNEFAGAVEPHPFHFDDPPALAETLRGAGTLFNTYWVRFSYRGDTFERAIANTETLIAAAEEAGVRRIVHVSIANPDAAPDLPYYAGKARLERSIARSRLSHAILRPTVIFSAEDVLINNIAWFLRHFPVFAVPGDGRYCLRPIYVEDFAQLAADLAQRDDNVTVDAVGPETYTFDELLRLIARGIGRPRVRLLHAPPLAAYYASRLLGFFLRDITLTRDEIKGLMADLLVTSGEPTDRTCLSEWLRDHGDTVGRHYASELARHYR